MCDMMQKGFKGAGVKFGWRVWHRPHLGKNPYLGFRSADFNQIRYLMDKKQLPHI